jgi:hypothetical protein
MKDHTVSSFDIEVSRRLSRRLAGLPEGAAPPPQPAAGRYTRFSVEHVVPPPRSGPEPPPPPAPEVPAAAPPAPPPAEQRDEKLLGEVFNVDPEGLDSWEKVLAWTRSVGRADTLFVVDPEGFVLSHRGAEPTGGFEDMGAELSVIMDRLNDSEEVGGRLRWLSIEYDSRWLSTFAARAKSGGSYIIACIGEQPLFSRAREAVAQQVRNSLKHLE